MFEYHKYKKAAIELGNCTYSFPHYCDAQFGDRYIDYEEIRKTKVNIFLSEESDSELIIDYFNFFNLPFKKCKVIHTDEECSNISEPIKEYLKQFNLLIGIPIDSNYYYTGDSDLNYSFKFYQILTYLLLPFGKIGFVPVAIDELLVFSPAIISVPLSFIKSYSTFSPEKLVITGESILNALVDESEYPYNMKNGIYYFYDYWIDENISSIFDSSSPTQIKKTEQKPIDIMTDFSEKAGEAGFSDEIEYFDYLCRTTEKPSSDDLAAEMKHYQLQEEEAISELFETQKIALNLLNVIRIAKSNGYPVDFNIDSVFLSAENEDPEVVRKRRFFRLKPGDILSIIFTSKNDINKYVTLLKGTGSEIAICDDVYFTKRIENYNIDIWVGSPKENSKEKDSMIRMIINGGYPRVLVTSIINEYLFTYCIIGGKKSNFVRVKESDEVTYCTIGGEKSNFDRVEDLDEF